MIAASRSVKASGLVARIAMVRGVRYRAAEQRQGDSAEPRECFSSTVELMTLEHRIHQPCKSRELVRQRKFSDTPNSRF